ncbi:Os03g0683500, partial [Oryza sativa Japonica Group]
LHHVRRRAARTRLAVAAMAALFFVLLIPLILLAGGGQVAVESAATSRGKLIMVDLLEYGSGAGTLAMRVDTIHAAGFANRSGHWHALRGNGHLFDALGLAAARLPFGNTYADLVGGVANLRGLPISMPFTNRAATVLSGYDPATAAAGGDGEAALKRALATLTVAIGEAQRLRPVMDTLLFGGLGARVADEHLPYIEHWDAMWEELTRWRRSGGGAWGGPFTGVLRERANIGSAEDALAVIGVAFRDHLLRGATMPDLSPRSMGYSDGDL